MLRYSLSHVTPHSVVPLADTTRWLQLHPAHAPTAAPPPCRRSVFSHTRYPANPHTLCTHSPNTRCPRAVRQPCYVDFLWLSTVLALRAMFARRRVDPLLEKTPAAAAAAKSTAALRGVRGFLARELPVVYRGAMHDGDMPVLS